LIIAPGEEGEFPLVLTWHYGLDIPTFRTAIRIETSDLEQPEVYMFIRGTIVPGAVIRGQDPTNNAPAARDDYALSYQVDQGDGTTSWGRIRIDALFNDTDADGDGLAYQPVDKGPFCGFDGVFKRWRGRLCV
jgi:hypothetical protein